jgi:hypothetical protein
MGKWFAGIVVLVVVAASTLTAQVTPAHAEDFPWCTELDAFTRNCSFTAYDECAAVAKSIGAMCVRNANYHPAPKPAPSHRAKQAKH